ncbi:FAD-binding dehydrogenase [Ramlibacter monticola]|uniref:FAD-binding dehydrogenase n=1 Tax=Ramlibacter monticola TaxID=1926872 RepID=A0A937CSG2_9BURK|nr:FAD-binding dehydrogenase [Ramlibacter monticola]MBL0390062.1 FAD-binding dehydrogenase [Ramlibacter monticola]
MPKTPDAPPVRHDTLIAGGGLAGIVTALELLAAGQRVMLLERGDASALGGLALQAFGGMCLVDTPLQRRAGIRDSQALAWSDWQAAAEFGEDDAWPRAWAQHYLERCVPEIYEWLRGFGLRFIPAVQWVERGLFRPGNSVPRYHVLWGTSRHMARTLLDALEHHPRRANLTLATGHEVQAIAPVPGGGWRCRGTLAAGGAPFEATADRLVVASGGIGGDLRRVRAHWPADLGAPPAHLLNGSHPNADGKLHDAVQAAGGRLTHLGAMWNYAAGVSYPSPHFEGHGLSLIPPRSALWLDPSGRRIGPVPLVSGFDTREMVAQIARAGWPHTWQVLNRRIALRELAASGAEHNPLIRDRRALAFAWQMLSGRGPLADELLAKCPDFVQASTLPELAARMNALAGDEAVDPALLARQIAGYDAQIARGERFHDDDQLRRIAQLRLWPGDRVRICKFQQIVDPAAGPLIAIRCRLLVRKSMGGIQTDLHSRVLGADGQPLPGLYAVGEAAGFGGGGLNGRGSLEGTFLAGCILTARSAARHLAT